MIYLEATTRAIQRHGLDLTYVVVTTGVYSVELGKTINTKTPYVKKLYPKQFIANQYNFPALVGKETIMFYLSNDTTGFIPSINDEITYKTKVYKVQSIQ